MEPTKRELKKLANVLEKFENRALCDTGMKNINGGYAFAEMYNYDDDYFDVELKWGEQNMGAGHSYEHTEQYKLNRKTLEFEN